MKKSLTLIVACLGAAAWSVVAQTPPPSPGGPPAPGASTNAVRSAPTRQVPMSPGAVPPAPGAPASVTPAAQTQTPTAPAAPVSPAGQFPPPPATTPPTINQAVPATTPAMTNPNVVGQRAPGAPGAVKTETLIPIENVRFANMELGQFLEFYSKQVGKTLIYGPIVAGQLKTQVSLNAQTELTQAELIQAMESVMAQSGIAVVPMGDKFIQVVPEAMTATTAARFNTGPVTNIPESQSYETRIVQLTNTLPSEVAQVLAPLAKLPNAIQHIDNNRILILRDYAVNIRRMVELIEKIDVNVPMDVKLELIPIKYALSADMASVLGSLTSGGASTGTTTARRTGSTSGLSRTGTGGTGTTGFGGANTGGFTTQQNRPGTPQPLSNVAGNQSAFQNQLAQIAQRAAAGGNLPILGDAKILSDERTNSLLVFGTEEERKMIKEIIAKLDVVQQQVLIEAVIMEVSLSDNLNFGVAAANSTSFDKGAKRIFGGSKFADFGSLTNFPGNLGDGFSYFGQMGSWDLAVNAIAGNGSVNVLSRPRIQTSHAVEASLFVGQTVPFITGSTTDINGGARSQFSNQQVGITLNVLPLINQEGLVVLDILQSVAQLGEDRLIDGNAVPTTTERNANARVAVRNGETVILGGFISSNKRKTKTGVPYLKDIPLLGALFSQKVDDNQRVELIVLIRPTVLETPEFASKVAESERQRLSGVRKAEMEIKEEEAKLANKSEKEMEKMRKAKKPVAQEDMLTPSSPLLPPPATSPDQNPAAPEQ